MMRYKLKFAFVLFGALIGAQPVFVSEWNYGCKGALPVFNGNTIIIFDRDRLAMLPKSWVKGTLQDLGYRDATDQVVEIAKATDNNSGLAPKLVFTHLVYPDKKVTLTEKSSKTVSEVRRRAGSQPRYEYITIYKKVYSYVSDFGVLGYGSDREHLTPLDVQMDCINYELSAPIR